MGLFFCIELVPILKKSLDKKVRQKVRLSGRKRETETDRRRQRQRATGKGSLSLTVSLSDKEKERESERKIERSSNQG